MIMAQTRAITINIRRYLVNQPRPKRARKAVRYLRERIAHYTKTDLKNVKIEGELNSMIIREYSKRMVPIKTNVNIDDNGIARVSRFGATKPAEAKAGRAVKKERAAPAQKSTDKGRAEAGKGARGEAKATKRGVGERNGEEADGGSKAQSVGK